MKVRANYVPNSSSSSFVCEVCGDAEGGYGMSLSDASMFECENGHVFCRHHAVEEPQVTGNNQLINVLGEELDECSEDDFDDPGCVPAHRCPICTLRHIPDGLALEYLIKWYGLDKDDLYAQLRKFGTWENLWKEVTKK